MSDFLTVDQFLNEYVRRVIDGEAAVFAGAGLSRAAGFVDWKGLLRDFATELKLDLDIETDLPAVAQYHLNREPGAVRSRLNQKLADELAREAELTDAHRALAGLNLPVIWTSNYDDLIERAVKTAGKKVVVRAPSGQVSGPSGGAAVEVVKLHGDIKDPNRVVITKDDYERYARENEAFLLRLKNDLLTRSFLFLGFSFTDPNLEIALSQVRQLTGSSPPLHYAVFKRPQADEFAKPARYLYELNRWRLRLQDLKRYGVQPVEVRDYDEIPALLVQLRLRVLRRRVLVSGSSGGDGEWTVDRLGAFCYSLGQRIIKDDLDLSNGFGLGVGSPVITGAVEELFRSGAQVIERRLLLRPFPQAAPRNVSKAELWERYRRDLVASAGVVVVVAGSKLAPGGVLVPANGVRREAEIARELGKRVLPVGASGFVARELWSEMRSDMTAAFPVKMPRRPFATLGRASASDSQLLDALFELVNWLRDHQ